MFVCHSLGGIVLKKAMMHANDRRGQRQDCQELLNMIEAIFFMGTPHRGSETATLGSICADMMKAASLGTSTNTALVKQLKKDSRVLQQISIAFTFIAADFKIFSFIENDRMPNWNDVIVPDYSARLNLPNENVYILDGNHTTICKFPKETQNYKLVAGVICNVVSACTMGDTSIDLSPIDSFTDNLDMYSTLRAEVMSSVNIEDLEWFFTSPEFEHWHTHDSEVLWHYGAPGSGKTILLICLWERLSQYQTYSGREELAVCLVETRGSQTPENQIAQIVCTIIGQLLRREGRLANLDQKGALQGLERLMPRSSPSSSYLNKLWQLLFDAIDVLPSREVIILLDAIDELQTEKARQTFLRNLLQLRKDVLSRGSTSLKIFITSKPYEDIREELRAFPSLDKDTERQHCLQSLKFSELTARRDLVTRAHSSTLRWLKDDVEYTRWVSSKTSALLLIRGKPGSGKSTLAKSILEAIESENNLYEDPATSTKALIADFFYSFRGGNRQTNHTFMLRSLLYQLLQQEERLFPLFQDKYRAQLSNPEQGWQFRDLGEILTSLASLKTAQTIYIFLDAMDESSLNQRSEILRLVSELCAFESSCNFKCLIATRPINIWEIDDRKPYCHHIILQEKNKKDIEKIISLGVRDLEDTAMEVQARDNNVTPSRISLAEVKNYMIKHADGVFLWVKLVLQELKELVLIGASRGALERSLERLPVELEAVYRHILGHLVNNSQLSRRSDLVETSRKMLAWATFSLRPLTTEEFADAIAMPLRDIVFRPDKIFLVKNRAQSLGSHLKTYCGPLLEIQNSVVQLLHLTAREFLLQEDRRAEPFDMNEQKGDMDISLACIRYLRLLPLREINKPLEGWELKDFDDFVIWLHNFRLLEYVVSFLGDHMERLSKVLPVFTELATFFREARARDEIGCLFFDWMKDLQKHLQQDRIYILSPSQFKIRCLVAAARNGSPRVVESLLQLWTEVNGMDVVSRTFPIIAAACGGHNAAAQVLQKWGADLESTDALGRTALHNAAVEGHTSMVDWLLSMGAQVDVADHEGESALHLAADIGNVEMLKLLLNKGANRSATDAIGRSALHRGAMRGHKSIVSLLLDELPIDLQDQIQRTALHWAAANGQEEVVQLLLERRARLTAGDVLGRTALHWAAMKGKPSIVQLLISAGMKLHSTDTNGRTPLHFAVIEGQYKVVDLLFNYRVNPDIRDNTNGTALHWAVIKGRRGMLKMLLEHGAKPDIKSNDGWTALQLAAEYGKMTIAGLLLQHGADPNAAGNNGRTALQLAAESGKRSMVGLLLQYGADPNAAGDNGRTAFPWLVRWREPTAPVYVETCEIRRATTLDYHDNFIRVYFLPTYPVRFKVIRNRSS